MTRLKIFIALVVGALLFPIAARTQGLPIPNTVSQTFYINAPSSGLSAGPDAVGTSHWMALNGQGACTITFNQTDPSASVTVQGAGDAPNAYTFTPQTVTGINTTGVIAPPTLGAAYGGTVLPQATTFIRLNVTALTANVVAGSLSCTTASGISSGGGSGGSVVVSPLPLPVNVQNSPNVVVANSSANPVPVAPPTGTYAVSIATTVPVSQPTNAADSGVNEHIVNATLPPVAISSAVPLTIASLPPVTVSNLGTPAPYVIVAPSPGVAFNPALNSTATAAPLNLDAAGNLLTNNIAGFGSSTTNPQYTRIQSGSASALATVFTPGDAVTAAGSLLTESFGMGYNQTANNWDRIREAAGFGTSYTQHTLASSLCDPIQALCATLDANANQNINVAALTPQSGSGTSTSTTVGDVIPSSGYGGITYTTTGTYTGTYALQASSDGGVTYPWTIIATNSSYSSSTSNTANNSFRAGIAGYDHVRVIFTAYTSGTLNVAWNLSVPPPAPFVSAYAGASSICTNTAATTCATVQTPNTGQTFSSSLYVAAAPLIYNGTTTDPQRKDTYAAGPIWVTPGGATNLAIAVGTAGPTVVKASAGRIVQFLVTTAGTTSETFYDNASACSGTIIGITPASSSVGSVYTWNYTAVNGITGCGAASTSPAGTLAYF